MWLSIYNSIQFNSKILQYSSTRVYSSLCTYRPIHTWVPSGRPQTDFSRCPLRGMSGGWVMWPIQNFHPVISCFAGHQYNNTTLTLTLASAGCLLPALVIARPTLRFHHVVFTLEFSPTPTRCARPASAWVQMRRGRAALRDALRQKGEASSSSGGALQRSARLPIHTWVPSGHVPLVAPNRLFTMPFETDVWWCLQFNSMQFKDTSITSSHGHQAVPLGGALRPSAPLPPNTWVPSSCIEWVPAGACWLAAGGLPNRLFTMPFSIASFGLAHLVIGPYFHR
jgi:hypothetical protein